jgi:hypothetical protein
VTGAVGGGRVEVVRVADEHFAALSDFYRRVWDPSSTPEAVAAGREEAARLNVASPGEAPPTWIVIQDGRAIAHITTIPLKLWVGGVERPAYWLKGLWVLPEHQRSSAGFLVLRAAVGLPESALALVHEPAAIRLFQAVGFTDLGGLPNRLRILKARSVLARLDVDKLGLQGLPVAVRAGARLARIGAPVLGPLYSAASGLQAVLGTGRLADLTSEVAPTCDAEEIENLWRAVRAGLTVGPARGGAALCRRYRGSEYVFVKVRSRSHLVALGIVKRPRAEGDPRLGGARISTLSDFLYDPRQHRTGLALLRGAERAAREFDADALLCGASAGGVNTLLRRRGYLRFPANIHVLARIPGEKDAKPPLLGDWWVTRGDSEADGSF